MSWNYRIIKFEENIALHEVHYNEPGEPVAYTENAVSFVADLWEGKDGITGGLQMALNGCEKPMLTPADFSIDDAVKD